MSQPSTPKQSNTTNYVIGLAVLLIGAGGIWGYFQWKKKQQRRLTANSLKRLGLALHNYHDVVKGLPVASGGKGLVIENRTLRSATQSLHEGLSWRVALLPFFDPDLYSEFALDEPWDSATNKPLIQRMPEVFRHPRTEAPPGHTFFRGVVGTGVMERPHNFSSITDGSSNTAVIIEADKAVIWTKPDELVVTPDKPLPKLGRHWGNGTFYVALGDGAVTQVKNTISEKTFRNLVNPQDGQVIHLDE